MVQTRAGIPTSTSTSSTIVRARYMVSLVKSAPSYGFGVVYLYMADQRRSGFPMLDSRHNTYKIGSPVSTFPFGCGCDGIRWRMARTVMDLLHVPSLRLHTHSVTPRWPSTPSVDSTDMPHVCYKWTR